MGFRKPEETRVDCSAGEAVTLILKALSEASSGPPSVQGEHEEES